MNSLNSRSSVLVVSGDVGCLIDIRGCAFDHDLSVISANNLTEATEPLQNYRNRLLGTFIGVPHSLQEGISVVRASKINRPMMPIYLIRDNPEFFVGLGAHSLRSLGVTSVLSRPLQYERLEGIIGRMSDRELNQSSPTPPAVVSAQMNVDVLAKDSKFFPVNAFELVEGEKMVFDIYLKINEQKYFKIVHAGDEFEISRVKAYLKKGVTYFYIRKDAQEPYIQFCDHVISLLVE